MREEIGGQMMKLEDSMEYSRYFQKPKPSYPSQERQRKFELFNPSQAKLEEQQV